MFTAEVYIVQVLDTTGSVHSIHVSINMSGTGFFEHKQ